VLAGQAGSGLPGQQVLSDDEILRLAAGLEGHPDNAAACLAGGLTISWTSAAGPRLARLRPVPGLSPVICLPGAPLATPAARQVLPAAVPHAAAAANSARAALLVAALTQLPDGADTLLAATRDWLHQDYRAEAMPETAALVGRLRAAGIPAVISGAGPSVLALLPGTQKPDYRHHLDSLGSTVRETGIAWHVSSLDVERHGARVLRPEPLMGC
jgi:homoserine kinase